MDKVDGFIALASSRYGERTCNPACTYYEVEEWQRKCSLDASKPAVMLVRCIPVDKAFHKRAVEARQLFSNDANELYALWDSKQPRKVRLILSWTASTCQGICPPAHTENTKHAAAAAKT